MGNHDDGAAFLVELKQDVQDFVAHVAVQVSGRFIGQDEGRASHNGARNGDPLFLPPGKLGREVFHAVAEPHFFQSFFCQFPAIAAAAGAIEQGDFHVVQYREVVDEVETLENEANLLIADTSQLLVFVALQLAIVDGHFTFGRLVKQTHDVEQSTFATARRAHDGYKLPFLDVYIDVVQGQGFNGTGAVHFFDAG